MGKKHHGPSFDKGHSHHKHGLFGGHHHGKHDHHHGKHDFLLGTRGDDVLEGSGLKDLIVGLKGNDKLLGKDGNDWLFGGKGKDLLDGGKGNDKLFGEKGADQLLGGEGNDKLFGGKGNDVLDGGAGSDKVFGGKGDDVAVYTMAENTAADACGNETCDFYDGGKGHDVLRLILTKDELARDDVQKDIADFQAFLDQNPGGCARNGEVFEFQSFGLVVRNFEELEIESGNAAPVATADTYAAVEDTPLVIKANPVNKGVLANDTDADGDPLTAILVDGPKHGTLVLEADGSFVYTPEADYNDNYPDGPDSFTYVASDGTDVSAPVSVVINITPVSDPPRPVQENWTVDANGTIRITFVPGPVDEADETFELLFAFVSEGEGSASLVDGNTAIEYTASANPGTSTIDYLVTDEGGGFNSDSVDVNVV